MIKPESNLRESLKKIDKEIWASFFNMGFFFMSAFIFHPILFIATMGSADMGEEIHTTLLRKTEKLNKFIEERNAIAEQIKEAENG